MCSFDVKTLRTKWRIKPTLFVNIKMYWPFSGDLWGSCGALHLLFNELRFIATALIFLLLSRSWSGCLLRCVLIIKCSPAPVIRCVMSNSWGYQPLCCLCQGTYETKWDLQHLSRGMTSQSVFGQSAGTGIVGLQLKTRTVTASNFVLKFGRCQSRDTSVQSWPRTPT